MEGVLEGLSEKGFSSKNLQKGEKHLPWKGHNSGKPLLVTRLDATPFELVARIIFDFFVVADGESLTSLRNIPNEPSFDKRAAP